MIRFITSGLEMFLVREILRGLEIWEICLGAAECPEAVKCQVVECLGVKCRAAKGMKAVERQAVEHLATGNKEEGYEIPIISATD